jgi:hypothetical protein
VSAARHLRALLGLAALALAVGCVDEEPATSSQSTIAAVCTIDVLESGGTCADCARPDPHPPSPSPSATPTTGPTPDEPLPYVPEPTPTASPTPDESPTPDPSPWWPTP